MNTIYVIDRANQFHTLSFDTEDAAHEAADRWLEGGHDVYQDYLQAVLAYDRYAQFLRK